MKRLQTVHFQQIIDSAMDAIISMDESRMIFLFNKAAEQMFGRTATEVLGQSLDLLIPERYRVGLRDHIMKFGSAEPTSRRIDAPGRILGLHAEGREFPIEASISHINSENGKIYTVVLRDISERIRAEEIVAERLKLEDTLSKMAASTPGLFIVYEAKSAESGSFLYLSPGIAEIFGPAAPNMYPNSPEWIKLIHPDDRENVRKVPVVALESGKIASNHEYRVLHPTRGEIWVEALRNMQKLPDGSVRIYSYVSEITARKKQELALQQSERQLREILDNMSEGYQIIGFDWRYKFFNNTFVKQSRHSAEELMSRTVQELYPGIENSEVYEAYQRCFSGRLSIRMENEFRFPDGSAGWFDLFFQPTLQGLSILSVDITERKQHEMALQETQRQLYAALRISGVGSFELDLTTGIVAASPRLLEIFGMESDTAFRREDFFRLIHTEDRGRILQASETTLRGGKMFNEVYRILRDSGELRWVHARAELTSDDKGIKRYTGAIIDITEQKITQEYLKNSEERFRQVVENIEEVFWMTDVVKNTILYISPAYEKIWGRTVKSLYESPRAWIDAIHPDDRARVLDAAMHQSDGTYNEEYRVVKPDGSVVWITDRAFPIRDAEGYVYRVAGVAQDITERKKLQTELKRFVELSPTVLYALRVEPTGLKTTWRSQNLAILTGFDLTESDPGTWWLENIHAEDRERVMAAHTLPYNIDHQVLEYRFKKKSGAYFWVRDEKRLIRDTAGMPSEVIGSLSDITDRLQLETQMRQAQKMEAIGQLAAGVAHDFNNLLTVISGNASLILDDGKVVGESSAWCNEILEASDKAAYLTRQLLLVGRKQSLELKSLDLNEAIRQTLGMLQRILGEDIDIRLRTTAVLPIYADAGMLNQILLNLAVNSRDAMPHGGVWVIESKIRVLDETTANSIPGAKAGKFACLSVSDTGSGIPHDVLPRIFEPFFSTKEIGKGTGLGLATVFGIVQQHRGWINVYSESGHGTTFRIYLPLLEGQVTPADENAGPAKLATGNETILLVEDQVALRKMTMTFLSRLGYRILEAGTGNAALALWEKYRDQVTLVISDIVMPDGMNGFELAKRLLAEKINLKIIYTSGYSPDLIKLDNPLTEGENFIAKPYSLSDLATIVRRNLDGAFAEA